MTAPQQRVLAVDGPSGSGKSSVCRAVARRLGLAYLDTGAMYRALCLHCLREGIDVTDGVAVAGAAEMLDVRLDTDPALPRVFLAGDDVSRDIRTSHVSLAVSDVARHRGVRAELVRRQRLIIEGSGAGCVTEGRDTTTVVAPDAPVRVLLVADEAARVARRARQLHGSTGGSAVASTVAEVVERDVRDSRTTSFLEPAPGVVVVDSSNLDFEETVEAVMRLVPPSWHPTVAGRNG